MSFRTGWALSPEGFECSLTRMGGERALIAFRETWVCRFDLKLKAYIIGQLTHLLREVTDAKLT